MSHPASSPDPVRAAGPPAVTEGTPDGPIVLVLDPAGAAKHAELPATWRELAEDWQITWCRLPSPGALTEADDLLADPPRPGRSVHVVASGPFADDALSLAQRHTDTVRSVLLIDPAADRYISPDRGDAETRHWEEDTAARRTALADAGVEVKVVAYSTGGERDRVPAPIPLGHPDVAEAVRQAIEE
ncbi:hypothetical protein [Amycolatopsis taiwanensis]|uniref:Alpha/beta hydrolase n=1 Tax=Amycolatopsis taiwanensis TaxID=342230 RepID=A0A9W6R171_9PSEU|nr:hypothetical protein [Amycolatopsis taiwanensis]GLY65665.1 hypothetical protein Atai01_22840 [Amycolatopsis taiwanensis]